MKIIMCFPFGAENKFIYKQTKIISVSQNFNDRKLICNYNVELLEVPPQSKAFQRTSSERLFWKTSPGCQVSFLEKQLWRIQRTERALFYLEKAEVFQLPHFSMKTKRQSEKKRLELHIFYAFFEALLVAVSKTALRSDKSFCCLTRESYNSFN